MEFGHKYQKTPKGRDRRGSMKTGNGKSYDDWGHYFQDMDARRRDNSEGNVSILSIQFKTHSVGQRGNGYGPK